MTSGNEDLRLAVYHGFARDGRAPSLDELVSSSGRPGEDVRAGLRALAAERHLVLDVNDGVILAHPFSSVPMGFSVMGRRTLWWGGCAWDAFALPHLVPEEDEVLVATTCPACHAPHAWVVGTQVPPNGAEVAHFLTPMARVWDDVVRTCANQRVFCDPTCVEAWLSAEGRARGYVMDLPALWRLAAGWYAGRLDEGYQRREPAEAAEYFRQAGLRGAFWGLTD